MPNILLLRAPSQDPPDRYESIFPSPAYRTTSLPVLETVHTNLAFLQDTIARGPTAGGFAGVILTSKRSCDAWRAALPASPSPETWSPVPFYVVGQGTASALRDAYRPGGGNLDIRGESSGTGERLAQFIVHDMPPSAGKLLYLTGDKNRDTLPGILRQGSIEFEPLQVYETRGSSDFERALREALLTSPKDDTTSWWIVYFAPSAADFVTSILRTHFDMDSCKIASIGPTTEVFLREKLDLRVDVVAPQPTPEGLFTAIAAHEENSKART